LLATTFPICASLLRISPKAAFAAFLSVMSKSFSNPYPGLVKLHSAVVARPMLGFEFFVASNTHITAFKSIAKASFATCFINVTSHSSILQDQIFFRCHALHVEPQVNSPRSQDPQCLLLYHECCTSAHTTVLTPSHLRISSLSQTKSRFLSVCRQLGYRSILSMRRMACLRNARRTPVRGYRLQSSYMALCQRSSLPKPMRRLE
jgi:hypothetical protein